MSNIILFSLIFGTFLFFMHMIYKRLKAEQSVTMSKQMQIKKQILDSLESTAKLDLFLKEATYYEPIAKVQDKPVYKYIYNKGFLYEFKDFLPRDKKIILMNDDAISFDFKYYARVNVPDNFIEKYLSK